MPPKFEPPDCEGFLHHDEEDDFDFEIVDFETTASSDADKTTTQKNYNSKASPNSRTPPNKSRLTKPSNYHSPLSSGSAFNFSGEGEEEERFNLIDYLDPTPRPLESFTHHHHDSPLYHMHQVEDDDDFADERSPPLQSSNRRSYTRPIPSSSCTKHQSKSFKRENNFIENSSDSDDDENLPASSRFYQHASQPLRHHRANHRANHRRTSSADFESNSHFSSINISISNNSSPVTSNGKHHHRNNSDSYFSQGCNHSHIYNLTPISSSHHEEPHIFEIYSHSLPSTSFIQILNDRASCDNNRSSSLNNNGPVNHISISTASSFPSPAETRRGRGHKRVSSASSLYFTSADTHPEQHSVTTPSANNSEHIPYTIEEVDDETKKVPDIHITSNGEETNIRRGFRNMTPQSIETKQERNVIAILSTSPNETPNTHTTLSSRRSSITGGQRTSVVVQMIKVKWNEPEIQPEKRLSEIYTQRKNNGRRRSKASNSISISAKHKRAKTQLKKRYVDICTQTDDADGQPLEKVQEQTPKTEITYSSDNEETSGEITDTEHSSTTSNEEKIPQDITLQEDDFTLQPSQQDGEDISSITFPMTFVVTKTYNNSHSNSHSPSTPLTSRSTVIQIPSLTVDTFNPEQYFSDYTYTDNHEENKVSLLEWFEKNVDDSKDALNDVKRKILDQKTGQNYEGQIDVNALILKYRDMEGELITIRSTEELKTAIQDYLTAKKTKASGVKIEDISEGEQNEPAFELEAHVDESQLDNDDVDSEASSLSISILGQDLEPFVMLATNFANERMNIFVETQSPLVIVQQIQPSHSSNHGMYFVSPPHTYGQNSHHNFHHYNDNNHHHHHHHSISPPYHSYHPHTHSLKKSGLHKSFSEDDIFKQPEKKITTHEEYQIKDERSSQTPTSIMSTHEQQKALWYRDIYHFSSLYCPTFEEQKHLFDTTQIGKELGKGGFSVVYSAIHIITGQNFALKICYLEKLKHMYKSEKSDVVFARIVNEIKILEDIGDHPNIVKFIASDLFKFTRLCDEDRDKYNNGSISMIMELVHGDTLHKVVRDSAIGRLHENIVRIYAKQIVEALAYLHGKDIIHGDISPSNIMIDRWGIPKLIDFGLSRKINSPQIGEKTITGTCMYIAPEVMSQLQSSTASDIFSFGCIVLEALTGRRPYPELESLQEPLQVFFHILKNQKSPEITESEASTYSISKEALDFLSKCLCWNPTDRSTAKQLLQHPFLIPMTREEVKRSLLTTNFKIQEQTQIDAKLTGTTTNATSKGAVVSNESEDFSTDSDEDVDDDEDLFDDDEDDHEESS
ncbi:hypothetical protein C9374_014024 [Naegleria lovaniensis]|uniref:Protein kinase domain-containing protein n=1 Tax=Naegleria lovaniensis TaxID=51637 RepID=A0AA88H1E8_NAELO|nr:uncharacterized protein C9374_014024 [Naegleria lovaniensis]KAG2389464.1 hypothetical protein C9374_014024 [Naegleria lovaniensis]